MSTPSRHLSLTRQLVLPVVGLVLAAVLANVSFSAWLAARRSTEATRAAQQQVAGSSLTIEETKLSDSGLYFCVGQVSIA